MESVGRSSACEMPPFHNIELPAVVPHMENYMKTVLPLRVAIAVASLAALARPLAAQSNSGAVTSGGIDQKWSVTCTPTISGGSCYSGQAYVVTTPPAPWPTLPGSAWISTSASGSTTGAKTANGANNYAYVFSQSFSSLSSPMTLTAWSDNSFGGYSLNGGSETTVPGGTGAFNSGTPFTLFLAPGTTSVQLYTYGDGTTDGLDVRFTTTPEPS